MSKFIDFNDIDQALQRLQKQAEIFLIDKSGSSEILHCINAARATADVYLQDLLYNVRLIKKRKYPNYAQFSPKLKRHFDEKEARKFDKINEDETRTRYDTMVNYRYSADATGKSSSLDISLYPYRLSSLRSLLIAKNYIHDKKSVSTYLKLDFIRYKKDAFTRPIERDIKGAFPLAVNTANGVKYRTLYTANKPLNPDYLSFVKAKVVENAKGTRKLYPVTVDVGEGMQAVRAKAYEELPHVFERKLRYYFRNFSEIEGY